MSRALHENTSIQNRFCACVGVERRDTLYKKNFIKENSNYLKILT